MGVPAHSGKAQALLYVLGLPGKVSTCPILHLQWCCIPFFCCTRTPQNDPQNYFPFLSHKAEIITCFRLTSHSSAWLPLLGRGRNRDSDRSRKSSGGWGEKPVTSARGELLSKIANPLLKGEKIWGYGLGFFVEK